MAHSRRAMLGDIHALATSMPEVTAHDEAGRPHYRVRGQSFVFHRPPRPDAVDERGERLTDVICFHTLDLADKEALVQDPATPFFTTAHFDGYAAVLLRALHIERLTHTELGEVIEDAWLARAPRRLASSWLTEPAR